MSSLGYLIFITALLALAGVMLYLRFAARSSSKSCHHHPGEPFSSGVDFPRLSPREDFTPAWENPSSPTLDMPVGDDSPAAEQGLRAAPLENPSKSPNLETAYFDELQEAAAGLARLMRSSPATNMASPAIYTPDNEETLEVAEEADATALLEEPWTPSMETEQEAPVAREEEALIADTGENGNTLEELALPAASDIHHFPETQAATSDPESPACEGSLEGEALSSPSPAPALEPTQEESVVAVMDEPLAAEPFATEEEGAGLEEAPPVESHHQPLQTVELLGEEVLLQLDAIDMGLDALEDLVASIESSLDMLDALAAIPEDELSQVAEAA